MIYFETSALAKRYLAEVGSAQAAQIFAHSAGNVYTSRVTYAEVLSVLARANRDRRIRNDDYLREKQHFFLDWGGLNVVEVTEQSLAPVERLVERHGLRGFDAVHLCAALLLGKPDFACFDSRLQEAARAEGLIVIP